VTTAQQAITPRLEELRVELVGYAYRMLGSAAPGGDALRLLLSVAVDDVDGLLDMVRRLGGTVLGPPTDMPWGQRVAHILDPDGNAVNLTKDR
jgi:predicted enzyme related to lactoylglutathione lyase